MSVMPNSLESMALVVRAARRTVALPPMTGPPLSDLLGNSIVRIKVGTGRLAKTFHLHKNLLCQKVPFFDRIFNGAFVEGRNQASTLPEDHSPAFGLFVGWLYTGVIEIPTGSYLNDEIQLFGLAEKYDIVELADKTMDHLIGRMKSEYLLLSSEQMSLAYSLTHKDSKLRLFTARYPAYVILHFPSGSYSNVWCKVNIQRAITENLDLGGETLETLRLHFNKIVEDPRTSPLCYYHQHSETEGCPYESP